jgi:carbon monoxide dehydrogenase subunit G
MQIDARTVIQADRETVWKALIDKENIRQVIPGIEKIEVLEKPKAGVVGLKWTETRTLFGKSASATMWITEASDFEFYRTRCEEHGAVYQSSYELKPVSGGTELTMRFRSQSVTFGTKVFSLLLGWAFVGVTRKAMDKDLADIKASLEGKAVKTVP